MKRFVVLYSDDRISVDADEFIEGDRLEFRLDDGELVAYFDRETVDGCYQVGIPSAASPEEEEE